MGKLLSVLIVAIFLAAPFSAVAQDDQTGSKQVAVKKEASGQQANTAKHKMTRAESDAKYKAAHESRRGPSFKRRPMFK